MGDASTPLELLRVVAHSVPAFLAYLDRDERYRFVNREYERGFGRVAEQIVGKHVSEVIGAEAYAARVSQLARALAGEPVEFDGAVALAPGQVRQVRISYVPDVGSDGEVRGIVILVTDVTEQRMAEAALRVHEVIVESLSEGVCLVRIADQRIVYASQKLERMLAYGRNELLERLITSIEHEGRRPSVDHTEEEVGSSSEVLCITQDGRPLWCRVSMSTFVHPQQGPVELKVYADITERKQIQARLVLSDRMASVGTLAAGVAHEINNPLSYVITNLDMLAEAIRTPGATSEAQLMEMVDEARTGADRVRKVVRDLKMFSRADEERREPIELHQVLDLAINMSFNEIRHRARLEKEYGPVPVVVADKARLGQVFLNLLVNAAQALPDGQAHKHKIRVVTKTDASGRAVVEIHDTGPGVATEILSRIFDPFFTTKPVGVGTGLGLSICHGIVAALGGSIVGENAPGGGSIFRVSLPAAEDDADPEELEGDSVVSSHEASRGSILVIEDDVLVARSIQRALRSHRLVLAASGKEGLDRIASTAFDVILCDLMMPEMTGMELYAELGRRRPDLLERIVFVTGGAFSPAARSFLDGVANMRLEKPIDTNRLRAIVRRMLQQVAEASA